MFSQASVTLSVHRRACVCVHAWSHVPSKGFACLVPGGGVGGGG